MKSVCPHDAYHFMMCQRIGCVADRDHRLRDPLRRLAHADAQAAAEDDDLHAARRASSSRLRCATCPGSMTVACGIGTISFAPHSRDVRELRRDLVDEVPRQDERRSRAASSAMRSTGWIGMCVPGVYDALLVRVPVDGVVEEVGADPAVVEERVALAGRAVARDLLALATERRSGARAARASTPSRPPRSARSAQGSEARVAPRVRSARRRPPTPHAGRLACCA